MFRQWNKIKDKVRKTLEELARNLDNGPRHIPVPIPVPIPNRNHRSFNVGRRFYSTTRPIGHANLFRITKGKLPYGVNSIGSLYRSLWSSFDQKYFVTKLGYRSTGRIYNSPSSKILNSVKFPIFGRINGHYKISVSKFPEISIISLIKSIKSYDDSRFYNAITKQFEPNGCLVELELPQVSSDLNTLTDLSSGIDKIYENQERLKAVLSKLVKLSHIGNLPIYIRNDKIEVYFENSTKSEISNLLIDYNIDYAKIKPLNSINHINDLNKQLVATEMFTKPSISLGLSDYSINTADLSGSALSGSSLSSL